ncbi:DUF3822 family protein [Sungkyunkwania multivorans]|uniref:DUF3822 family protein n=1 Tax=Sungkyunkwania multivorans TaxID=1173618 RepID=A0ABW3CVI5_9FLAO
MTQQTSNNIDSTLKKLSIQVGLNGLSFCILDTTTQTIVDLQHHPFDKTTHLEKLQNKVSEIFEDAKLLDQSFQHVAVSYVNELATFVPKALFNDKKLADYIKFNNKILINDYITFDIVPNNDMVNVYVPYMNLNNYFVDCFGEFEYKHFATILVANVLTKSTNFDHSAMYVNIQSKQFEIIVIKGKKLNFYNSFTCETKEDFIYYLLFTIEQLALNTEELPLYFLGDIDEEDERYKLAYTYIRHVQFGNRNDRYSIDEHLKQVRGYDHYTLINNL